MNGKTQLAAPTPPATSETTVPERQPRAVTSCIPIACGLTYEKWHFYGFCSLDASAEDRPVSMRSTGSLRSFRNTNLAFAHAALYEDGEVADFVRNLVQKNCDRRNDSGSVAWNGLQLAGFGLR